jgi:hypothetical protein
MAKLSRQHKHSKRSGSKSKCKRKSSAWMDLEEAPPLRIMPDDPDEDDYDDTPPPKRSASSTTMVPTTYTEERVLEIQVSIPLMPLPRRH